MRHVASKPARRRAAHDRRAETEWIVLDARSQSTRDVCYFTDAAQAIARIEERLRPTAEPVAEVIAGLTIDDSLFAGVTPAPHHVRVGLHNTSFLFKDAHTPLESVIAELRSVRPDGDRDQLIARIPLKGAGAIGCEIAIRVVGQR